ncbi:Bro-a [Ectropis obliqua nucleopolyhedrovirus]|uniref:Bro-a n=1 Tax=Ectropis obliqua nucleopolyhedrovirus TaxID=59376 RepID=A0EYX9_9ABAC|nr:Bro-a [Ectropis obliqua nucleopolyhedrovirus]ABI35759.1 Bro-a [Ectropis obliqua nucleopolyhedrovirus]AGS47929.1 putative Bro-N domain-containing protein L2 [Ectropis obliqua nucleopolyhedrovirus]QWV59655.1 Bro-a [Ectropis obliqua nucleopolyhedrovirus]UYO72874.1 Bro-a [Ectropis obliqua nucleopolyhedrovirus]
MSLTKVHFGDKEVETYTVDVDGEKWMVANPFAEALSYSIPHIAIAKFVTIKNQKSYDEIKSIRTASSAGESSVIPRNIQAKTKFINRAGVFELINASDMPGAKRFKAWNTNDLLPTLCQEGEYKMAKDAPADIAHGMNAVHVATNDGKEAPWLKEIIQYKEENHKLTASLQECNSKLIYFAEALVESNKTIVESNKTISHMAMRMADIAQDVIAKPTDPQLLHSLAVCSMGGDQYAFIRPQKRSLKRSLDRLFIDTKDILFKADYVPNSMNVLNKVKEQLPKEKYTARHNKIILREDLTKDDLLDAVKNTVTERQVDIIVKKANNK